ncbi:hypothetical protein FA95DRAFT_622902 [Auriscalpium vulgare]|uniref:Uncharacterized protein n=1 Tax=Auriscalpium vulgare TaxID=40419 RepID=A0ACB8S3M8_9AGAM|nr:hypothetical protein FA95DRAFT_622902 [Auriscalpium vulgare]
MSSTPMTEQANFTLSDDQLSSMETFLDELETKTPLGRIRKEADASKAFVDTVNSLIVVGAFIAGVQAQLLAATSNSNDSPLEVATNWFGFFGLTLDIIGTSTGVAHTIMLQASIRQSKAMVLQLTTRIDQAKQEIHSLLTKRKLIRPDPQSEANLAMTLRGIYVIASTLITADTNGVFGHKADHLVLNSLEHPGKTGAIPSFVSRVMTSYAGILVTLTGVSGVASSELWVFGQIPVAAMGFGAFMLLLSVLCYATQTQPRGIWICCVAITAMTVCTSSLPFGDPKRRKRAIVFGQVQDQLAYMPSVRGLTFPDTRSVT